MTVCSYFRNAKAPEGFVVALLGEDRSEFVIVKTGDRNWIAFGDFSYGTCT